MEVSHTCDMRFGISEGSMSSAVQKVVGKGKDTLSSGILEETEMCSSLVLAQKDMHQTLPSRTRKS